mgnify:CR=1 FL=1
MEEKALKQVEEMLPNLSENSLKELRTWLFKESCRLVNQESALQDESKHLQKEKKQFLLEQERYQRRLERDRKLLDQREALVEQKLQMLREAYDHLDEDRSLLERERYHLEKEKSYLEGAFDQADQELLFCGVHSESALKKRYRDLMKIFHPDNVSGDQRVVQIINQQFESIHGTLQR